MIAFAALAASGGPRTWESLRLAMLGGVLGLVFLVFEGLAASLGRVGSLPPTLAVWGPTVLAALCGVWTLLLFEERV